MIAISISQNLKFDLLKKYSYTVEQFVNLLDHQFGFKNQHLTIDRVHRVSSIIKKLFETKKFCSAVFLDIDQAVDKV